MTNRSDLVLTIQANTDALKAVQADLGRIGTGSQGAATATVSAFDRIKQTAAGMGLERIGEAFVNSLKTQAGAAFTAGETLEGLDRRYTRLLGSQQAARTELGQLQTLANNSDYGLAQLAAAEATLIGTGKSAKDARTELIAIGNTASGLALTKEQAEGVTTALVQMSLKGRVSSEELNQLAERGVNGLGILATYLGRTTGETQKLVESGAVAASTFEAAFNANAARNFANAMQENAGTMRGLLSTAEDLRDQLGGTAMAEGFKELEPVLSRVLTELQNPQTVENVKAIGKALGDAAASGLTMAENIGKALGVIAPTNPTDTALTSAKAQLDALVQAHMATGTAAQQAGAQQTTALKDVEAAIRGVNRQEQDVRKAYRDLIDPLQEALRLENERYQAATKARDLRRAESKVATDTGLAGDIFTSAGQAARDRLGGEQDRVADLRLEQAHQQRVDGLNTEIAGRKRQEQADLDALDKEKRGLELQQETIRTTNGLLGTQAQTILTGSRAITDQIKYVQDLATAWSRVVIAQQGANAANQTTDAAATDASNMGQLGTGGPAPLLDVGPALAAALTSMTQASIADMLHPGSVGSIAAHHSAMDAQAALGTSFTAKVAGNTPETTAAVAAYQKWLAGEPLSPQETTMLRQKAPMAFGDGRTTAPLGTAGGTVGTSPVIKVYIGSQELKGMIRTEIADPANGQAISQNGANYGRGRNRGWDR